MNHLRDLVKLRRPSGRRILCVLGGNRQRTLDRLTPSPNLQRKKTPTWGWAMFQQELCDAIKAKRFVRIRYEADDAEHMFAPHIVYRSFRGKILVGGVLKDDPNVRLAKKELHAFALETFRSVVMTEKCFRPSLLFNPFDKIYRNGILCRVL